MLLDDYRGNWQNILLNFGLPAESLGTNKVCPLCGGNDRFTYNAKEDLYFCRHCGGGDAVKLLSTFKGWSFKELAKNVKGQPKMSTIVDKKPDVSKINRLLNGAKPITSTDLAGRYLALRLCPLPTQNSFYQPKAWGLNMTKPMPAMVNLIKDKDGNLLGALKTFLDGASKAKIGSPKQITKLSTITGGSIQLLPLTSHLGLAEGVEDALSAYKLFGVNTWACFGTHGLESFEVPSGVEKITIFSNRDKNFAGQRAAYILANNLSLKGFDVEVIQAQKNDFNDDLRNL